MEKKVMPVSLWVVYVLGAAIAVVVTTIILSGMVLYKKNVDNTPVTNGISTSSVSTIKVTSND